MIFDYHMSGGALLALHCDNKNREIIEELLPEGKAWSTFGRQLLPIDSSFNSGHYVSDWLPFVPNVKDVDKQQESICSHLRLEIDRVADILHMFAIRFLVPVGQPFDPDHFAKQITIRLPDWEKVVDVQTNNIKTKQLGLWPSLNNRRILDQDQVFIIPLPDIVPLLTLHPPGLEFFGPLHVNDAMNLHHDCYPPFVTIYLSDFTESKNILVSLVCDTIYLKDDARQACMKTPSRSYFCQDRPQHDAIIPLPSIEHNTYRVLKEEIDTSYRNCRFDLTAPVLATGLWVTIQTTQPHQSYPIEKLRICVGGGNYLEYDNRTELEEWNLLKCHGSIPGGSRGTGSPMSGPVNGSSFYAYIPFIPDWTRLNSMLPVASIDYIHLELRLRPEIGEFTIEAIYDTIWEISIPKPEFKNKYDPSWHWGIQPHIEFLT